MRRFRRTRTEPAEEATELGEPEVVLAGGAEELELWESPEAAEEEAEEDSF
jgi:hypothetical protein